MPDPHAQLLTSALSHHTAGNLAEAQAIYQQILQQNPNHAEALHLLGTLAHQTNRDDIAEKLILRAITLKPTEAAYFANLGEVYRGLNRSDAALYALGQAVALNPKLSAAWNTLGSVHQQLHNFVPARAAYEKALQTNPQFLQAWNNLASLFILQGLYADAEDACQKALALDAHYAGAHFNLAISRQRRGAVQESIKPLQETLQLDPNHADAHWALAVAHLLTGNFPQGWPEHEWRFKFKRVTPPFTHYPQPVWTGEDLTGKVIFINAEQGFGDVIQFSRYLPLVAERGPKQIIMECQPQLLALFENIPGVTLHGVGQPLPAFDFHIPLLSLPMIFGTTLETIPPPLALVADAARVAHFRNLLAGHSSAPGTRVGIAYSGNPTHTQNHLRSLPLAALAPLFQIPGVQFVSLQIGPAQKQIVASGLPVVDLSGQIKDFADTAALMANLDLVITTDTAVAHLAGTLGRPTWLLLHLPPDWRWLLERGDSPWYPGMKLFRRGAAGAGGMGRGGFTIS